MDLIGVIIFGGLGVYNFICGNNLAGTVLLVFAGLYLLKDVIAEMIEGRISRKKFQVIQIDIKPKWGELFKEYKLVSDDWNEDMVWDKIKDEPLFLISKESWCMGVIRGTVLCVAGLLVFISSAGPRPDIWKIQT